MSSPAAHRPRVLVAIPPHFRRRLFTSQTWAMLEEVSDVVINPADGAIDAPEARAVLEQAEIVLTGWGSHVENHDWVVHAPRLRALVHSAGSVRILVDEDALARGIQVSSQAEQNGRPVAEYSLAMILLAAKRVFRVEREYRALRRGFPLDSVTTGNHGARIGLVGASKIGRRLIRLLEPFDVDIQVHDPYLDAEDAAALGVRGASLDVLFATSDVVSVHAPLLPDTARMIGAEQFRRMRDGAVFVNTARGGLIDEEALVAELRTGRIDAVLDVTDPEVPAAESPLWDLPNVILTPHLAGSIGNEIPRLGHEAVAEVRRLILGEPLLYPVSPQQFAITA